MANYLYQTAIYFDTTRVSGVNPAQEATNTTDFETNYKSDTKKIDALQVAETTFVIDKTYSEFKDLISTPYAWSDVKRHDNTNHYSLYLITNEAL